MGKVGEIIEYLFAENVTVEEFVLSKRQVSSLRPWHYEQLQKYFAEYILSRIPSNGFQMAYLQMV